MIRAMILSAGRGEELTPLSGEGFPEAIVSIANISSIKRNVALLSS